MIPGRITIDRANYAQTTSTTKVDVYVTGQPSTQGRLPAGAVPGQIVPALSFYSAPPTIDPITGALSAPVGVPEIPMSKTGIWYWGQSHPATVPTAITLKDANGRDGAGNPVTAFYQAPVTDQIFITRSLYDPILGRLGVQARSSDEVHPPLLTLGGFGALTNGLFTMDLLSAPPSKTQVVSSAGGLNEAQVSTTLIPEAPTGVSAVAGNAQATVTFSPPASDGGSPITLYTVTSSPGGITATGPLSPITVTGLTNGTAYTFTVTATNGVGTGPASAPSNSVTPATVPDAPTIGLTLPGNTTATVQFIPPVFDGGNAVQLYTVTSTPGGLTASNSTGSPLTVTGLTNGVAYTFTVTATNAVGTSLPSAPSNSVIPATIPAAPVMGVAHAGNTQASVAFTPPASNGGLPILSYTATSTPGGLTATGTGSPLIVNSLTNGTTYTFTVAAANELGTGPASSASNGVAPGLMPDPPTSVVAIGGNTTASISFTPITPNSSTAIIVYTATSDPGGFVSSGTSSPLPMGGLTNGTAYTFSVTSTDAVGTGLPSAPSNSVTPATVPGSPAAAAATGGNGEATITFTPPVSNGGAPISSYTAVSSPGGLTASVTGEAPITVTGLTNGTAYTFTVTATNAKGAGLPSTPSNTVVPATVPGAPTAVSATAGNATASVSFLPPASNGGDPITLYTVTSTPGGITATRSASPIVVTGLTNGTVYTFKVTATNGVGTSALSAASNSVIPASVPGAPTSPSATAGNATANIAFTAPISNGGLAITSYTATSSPDGKTGTGAASPVTVTGLTNGTNYTFTVVATNPLGSSAPSVATNSVLPATTPGAPTGATATAGNASASIAFAAPISDGGQPITLYTVTASPGGTSATGSVSPINMSGLTNGTAYTFTVTATNAKGIGAASAPSNSVTPSALPGAPTGVSAVAGNALATVSFTAPVSNGGSPITLYTVTASPGGATGTGTVSPVAVTGLTNGSAYTFTVTASNVRGSGPASTASNSVTPATVPGAPTAVNATAGDTAASVAFTAPASNGGSPITLYTVTASPGGRTATGTASPVNVTGLTNGTDYSFTVTATNAMGIGAASAASNIVTPRAVPGAPTAVSAVGGNALASIAFTAPLSTGGTPITLYTATASPGGLVGTATASPVVVTGLTNGTAYTFTVTATNAAGAGLPSAPSNSVTPAALPGAPTAISATAGNTTANIAFAPPVTTGGSAITVYTVTASPGGRVGTGSASPVAVTGLTNGTAYSFTVTATNAAGTGPASVPSNFVTPASLPGAPGIGTASAGNTTASVTFSAASNGGSPITLYTVTASPGGGTGTGVASPVAVTGLTNGTAYTFTVRATNAIGTGPASGSSNSVTPSGAPGAPIMGSATAGNTTARVTFSPPTSNGGSAITLYTVTATPGGRTATGGASPITVSGLANGTTVTFTVKATNARGTGPASSPSNSVMPTSVLPAAPSALTAAAAALSANPPSVHLTWIDNSYNEASFQVQRARNAAFTVGLVSFTAPANATTYTDTTPGQHITYYYRVRSVNAIGSSAFSSTASATTPGRLPLAPTNLAFVSATISSVLVSFTDNAPNETGFRLERSTAGSTGPWTLRTTLGAQTATAPATVTATDSALSRNTTYWYRVQATNADGGSTFSNVISATTLP